MEGVVAAVLLIAGTLSGGNALSALQTAVRNGLLEITVKGGAAGKPQTIDIVDENDE